MSEAWSDPRRPVRTDETQELPLPPGGGYEGSTVRKFLPLIAAFIVMALIALAFFFMGYWVSPDDPSELDQVRSCAELGETPGYRVRIIAPNGTLILNTTCFVVEPG